MPMLRDCQAAYFKCIEGDHQLDDIRGTPCARLSEYYEFLAPKGALEVQVSSVLQSVSPHYTLKLFKGLIKGS